MKNLCAAPPPPFHIYLPPQFLSSQSDIGLVVRSNAFTEYKASKRLYDTSAAVPGANVGSDPARAFILADDSLLKTVRVACHLHALPADTDDDVAQVSAEALPFAGIGVKDFLPQAQQQVGDREQQTRCKSATRPRT
jgi:hypothetical protein